MNKRFFSSIILLFFNESYCVSNLSHLFQIYLFRAKWFRTNSISAKNWSLDLISMVFSSLVIVDKSIKLLDVDKVFHSLISAITAAICLLFKAFCKMAKFKFQQRTFKSLCFLDFHLRLVRFTSHFYQLMLWNGFLRIKSLTMSAELIYELQNTITWN